MWYWGANGVQWWGWFIGFVITVAFWGLFIYFIASLMRSFASRDHIHHHPVQDDPERMLARRFANGEIDEEEFHRRLDTLRSRDLGRSSTER